MSADWVQAADDERRRRREEPETEPLDLRAVEAWMLEAGLGKVGLDLSPPDANEARAASYLRALLTALRETRAALLQVSRLEADLLLYERWAKEHYGVGAVPHTFRATVERAAAVLAKVKDE